MADSIEIQSTEEDSEMMASLNVIKIEIEEIKKENTELKRLLEDHSHLGEDTKNIQDIIKQVANIDVKLYKSEGTAGLKQIFSVRNAADSGACSITVVNGIITATTC